MSLERKARIQQMHDSLVVLNKEGKAEGVLDPLPGQMSLNEILAIRSEAVLDELISAQLPIGIHAFKSPHRPSDPGKRFEMKQYVLARLMGISAHGNSIASAFDFVTEKGRESGGLLASTLEGRMRHIVTLECLDRIESVGRRVAREAGALVLAPENQKIMDEITTVLNQRKLQVSPPLTALDIVNIRNLPKHDRSDSSATERNPIDMGTVLKVFLTCVSVDFTHWDDIAARMGIPVGSVRQIFSRSMGERAKELIRKSRGYKKTKYPQRARKAQSPSEFQ